jgi:hypothetical protein
MRWISSPMLILLALGGCGERPNIAPVAGVITLDGKPLAGATITTQPIATTTRNPGAGSFGRTDGEGHFELELVKPAMKGAIIGEHRVIITEGTGEEGRRGAQQSADGKRFWTDQPVTSGAVAEDWPSKFTDGSLTMQVPPEGTDQLRLELTR